MVSDLDSLFDLVAFSNKLSKGGMLVFMVYTVHQRG